MATNSFYTDKLYPLQDKVLLLVSTLGTKFYLTGGTALSRGYYNHRYSDDLDFFVNRDSTFSSQAEQMIQAFQSNFEVIIITKTTDFVSLKIDQILKVDMVNDVGFRDGVSIEKSFFNQVDNTTNILSNKITAITSRDEPKNVVDIWVIAQNNQIDWPKIYQAANSKAVGIFPPDVAQKLLSLPVELLDKIKWVDGQKPDPVKFMQELNQICNQMLQIPGKN
jgi:predicted nucleotidyltransferase component of viral defense system